MKSRRFPGFIHRAFTLIEILVVIAIIAIIAAILFPVFARSRENARRASCQSNLKQIALGLKMYAQDYDSHYPKSSFLPATSPRGWADAIQPYAKSLQILQCPSETTPPNPDPASLGYTDYAYNANLGGKNESELVVSTSTILACEGFSFSSEQPKDGDNDPGTTTGDCDGDSTRPGAMPGLYQLLQPGGIMNADVTRHLSGGNYAFADGHVKWLLPDKIYNWCTAPANNATFAYK